MRQLNHFEFKKIQKKLKPNIVLILENFEHDENIGLAFRLADSFNCDKIFIVSKRNLNKLKIEKTARNCTKTIYYEIFYSIEEVIELLKNENYSLVSLEICDDSKSLREINFSKIEKIALILGSEREGVSNFALNNSDICTHIDMYGNNSSMNVATSLAICLYKICEDKIKNK